MAIHIHIGRSRKVRDAEESWLKVGMRVQPKDQPFMRGTVSAVRNGSVKISRSNSNPPGPQNKALERAIKEGYALSEFPGGNPDNFWWPEDEIERA